MNWKSDGNVGPTPGSSGRGGKRRLGCVIAVVTLLAVWLSPAAMGFSPGGSEPASSPLVASPTNAPAKNDVGGKAPEKAKWWDIVSALAAATAAIFAAIASWQTRTAARRTDEAGRAQRLSDLWPDLQRLTFLEKAQLESRDDPAADIVLANVNTMEKIAFCWKADLVKRTVLEKELGRSFVKLYDQIAALGPLRKLNRTGAQLLQQNPLSRELRDHLDRSFPNHSPPNHPRHESQTVRF